MAACGRGELVMGFLTTLFGGSDSSSGSQSTSGFGLLPQQIQQPYKSFGTAVNNQIPNATNAYTPIGQTTGETQAYNSINQGFTPNPQQLQSDIAMQQNPYNSSVLNQIQQQAYGQNSVLNSALTNAGQYGSNRQILGANDIANTQANTIGSILGGQYNTELQNALTTLPALRNTDASNQLAAGANQRQLALQQSSAPITGLQQSGTALGVLPSSGGSQSTSTSQSQSNNGIFKPIGL